MKWQKSWKLPLYVSLITGQIAAQSVMAGAVQFIDEASVDLKLKNAYFDNQIRPDKGAVEKWHQWGQGVEIQLSSGYLFDVLGVDFFSYHGLKLDAYNSTPGLSGANDELLGGGTKKSENYNRVGQLLLKAKAGNDDLSAQLKGGWLDIGTEFVATAGSRLTPSSFQGAELDFSIFGANLYGVFADKMALRTGETYDPFVNGKGEKIEYLYAAGAEVDVVGVRLAGEYAESKDYVRHMYGGVSYNLDLDANMGLLLDLRYYQAKKAGVLWTGDFIDDASLYNINLVFTYKTLELGFSHAGVQASGGGTYDYVLSSNEYGGGNYWTSRQVSDFNYDGENVYQVSGMFNFSEMGLPGLFAGLAYTYGTDFNKPRSGAKQLDSEYEFDLSIGYEFFEGELQGLKLILDNGSHYANYSGKGDTKFTNNMRFYVDYTLKVF